ncbi:MAG: branched-chain amino acid ABC transporter permease [Deltaproteobacteria bacterium HGW-Deltaproteobacteria-15]|jgi:branched-chain amino acid transport system permease protein|nr:MAG: branched-chain amino acid ABC transporter permease [Deltaproteobacteria bacterium HGW-Deltaproteobacteria-15]
MALLIYGTINSVILALYAAGFSLCYGISGIANFAHGALYILSGFTAWNLMNAAGLPFYLSAFLSVIITALVGFLFYWVFLLRVRGMPLAELIVTFAAGVGVLELLMWKGFYGMRYSLPIFMRGGMDIGNVGVDYQRLFVLLTGIVLMALLWLFVHHTRIGLAFRAMAQNERTALSVGIESDWIGSLSLAFGSALAAVAAMVVLPLGMMESVIGLEVLIYALAVAIVGGLESTLGMIAGSFIIGFGQVAAARYIGAKWMIIVPLAAIVLVLVVKPSGLFGKYKELEERV